MKSGGNMISNSLGRQAGRMTRESGVVVRGWGRLLAGCVGLLALAACATSNVQVFVPQQETAVRQFQYAIDYKQRHELILRASERGPKFERTFKAVYQTFEKVVEVFPEDRQVTPLARLEMAEMLAGLDVTGIDASEKQLRDALVSLQQIEQDYPEYEYVQAKSIYDQARVWVKLQDFAKAQSAFRNVIETYGRNQDIRIRRIVQIANLQYQKTYVK